MSTVTSAVKVATQGKLPLAEGRMVNLLTLQQPAPPYFHDREGFLVCPD
jgi:hypothetical protein